MAAKTLALFVMLTVAVTAGAAAARPYDVFTCEFPTHGTVVIDTGPDPSITVGDTRYPAQSGSYFYQGTEEGPLVDGYPIVIMFAPDQTWWEFQGERSTSCERRRMTG